MMMVMVVMVAAVILLSIGYVRGSVWNLFHKLLIKLNLILY